MAYVVYQSNHPQEHAELAHGSGARVQDHDPGTSQPAQTTAVGPLAQVMVAAEQIPRQTAAQQSSRPPPESESSEDDESSTPRWPSLRKQLPRHEASQQQGAQEMLENATLVTPFGKEDTAAELQIHAAAPKTH